MALLDMQAMASARCGGGGDCGGGGHGGGHGGGSDLSVLMCDSTCSLTFC